MNLITRCRQLVRRLKLGRAQKLVVAVVGGSVVLLGIAMIVLPDPHDSFHAGSKSDKDHLIMLRLTPDLLHETCLRLLITCCHSPLKTQPSARDGSGGHG
jgi:hypothetical protein